MPAKRTAEESRRLHEKIRRLEAEGVPQSEVARRCGCSRPLVHYVLTRARTRGDRTLAQGLMMLGQRRAGRTLAEIAEAGRVSTSTVLNRLKLARAHEAAHLEDEPS
jgi:DNA-directed RNA polymerase specialized sigma24 family protein